MFSFAFLLLLIAGGNAASFRLMSNTIWKNIPTYFLSFTLDYHNDDPKWTPENSILFIDLQNSFLRNVTSHLAPAILRIGGSQSDGTDNEGCFYNFGGVNCTNTILCLTPKRWEEILQFADDIGLHILYDLNELYGRSRTSPHSAPWNSSNTEALLAYTSKTNYLPWFEMGNEEQDNLSPVEVAENFKTLRGLINKYWPSEDRRPKLYGPSCHPYPDWVHTFCKTQGGCEDIDVFGFHLYTGYGLAPKIQQQLATSDFLYTMQTLVQSISDVIQDSHFNMTMALTETAGAWAGGNTGTTNTFEDGYFWIAELGYTSQLGFDSVQRQTLVGGNYGLLDKDTHKPNPDYFTSIIFKRLVGTRVLKTYRQPVIMGNIYGKIFVFAYCLKNDNVAVFMYANVSDQDENFDYSMAKKWQEDDTKIPPFKRLKTFQKSRKIYSFTNPEPTNSEIFLNGVKLQVDANGGLPNMDGKIVASNKSPVFAAKSYGFFVDNKLIPACSN